MIHFVEVRRAQTGKIERILLARQIQQQELGNELTVRAELVVAFVIITRIQTKRQFDLRHGLQFSSAPHNERAKITGPSVPHLLPSKRSSGLQADE